MVRSLEIASGRVMGIPDVARVAATAAAAEGKAIHKPPARQDLNQFVQNTLLDKTQVDVMKMQQERVEQNVAVDETYLGKTKGELFSLKPDPCPNPLDLLSSQKQLLDSGANNPGFQRELL